VSPAPKIDWEETSSKKDNEEDAGLGNLRKSAERAEHCGSAMMAPDNSAIGLRDGFWRASQHARKKMCAS
jgi:hypothetical protein